MKTSLFIVQPYITNYRLPIFKQLSEKEFKINLCAVKDKSFDTIIEKNSKDFSFYELKEISILKKRLFWQKDLLTSYFNIKPDVLFVAASPRYISTWILIIIAKLMNKKIFLHGQGLYNKNKISFFNKITYKTYNILCDSYICYTSSSKESLKKLNIYQKCSIAENSIINKDAIFKQDISKKGILFIGRLRKGSNIELLIDAIKEISKERNLVLHIIGGGESLKELKKRYNYSYIKFYGPLYDNFEISKISKQCIYACYPGDSGLSVLHYMSLSLPVVIHSDMKKHMGPEPSYIKDNFNGLLFERNNYNSLKDTLKYLNKNDELLLEMQANAFKTYENLTSPSLSERFYKIIKNEMEGKL